MAGERKPQREEPAAAAARSPPPPGRPWLGLGRGCQSRSSCRSLEGAGARVGSGAKPRPRAARWAGSAGVGRTRGCPACPQIPAGDEAQEGTDTGLRVHSETHAASHEAPSVFPSELFLPHFSPDRSKPTMGPAHHTRVKISSVRPSTRLGQAHEATSASKGTLFILSAMGLTVRVAWVLPKPHTARQ